ncbi:hypothetical protein CHH80_00650 [Bacillus sp. 7504-2]|nr:hypothetical protein CHH80_00650 [Bacillus sp. 7504-2]
MRIYFEEPIIILCTLIGISLILILRYKYKKSTIHLLFTSLFYIYICMLIKYTQFPITFLPDIMSKQSLEDVINIVPFINFMRSLTNYLLNILMTIPFGFLLPLIKKCNLKTIFLWSLILPIMLEGLQLLFALLKKYTERIVDINDAIMNGFGVLIGFIFYKVVRSLVKKILKNDKEKINPLIEYFIGSSTSK